MVEAAGATSNSSNNDNSRRGSTISCPGMQTAKTQAADRRLKNQSDESAFMTDSFIFILVLDLPSCLIWPASSIRNIHGNSGGRWFGIETDGCLNINILDMLGATHWVYGVHGASSIPLIPILYTSAVYWGVDTADWESEKMIFREWVRTFRIVTL